MPVIMMPRPARDPRPACQPAPATPNVQRIRRRGSARQGRALETLGHAVEYLVDSRLFTLDEKAAASDAEAAQILMRLSRAVFAECPEVLSLQRRLKLWLVERLPRPMQVRGAR